MIGPFPSADRGTDFFAEVGGEAGVAPRVGDRVITAEGDTLVWRRYSTWQDIADLGEALGDHEQATAYAYCQLQSESAGEAGIDLRTLHLDDQPEFWLNGEWFGLDVHEGANSLLLKIPHSGGRWGFSLRLYPPERAVLAGAVFDEAGEPVPYADLLLERDGAIVAEWQADYWGEYEEVNVYPADGLHDLSVTAGTHGTWRLGLELRPGDRLELTQALREAVSISGTLLMPDDITPHAAVPVQALRVDERSDRAEVVATTFSDAGGKYRFINLKPGRYRVRCQIRGGYLYYGAAAGQSPAPAWESPLVVEPGDELDAVDFRFVPFKKGTWRTISTLDGLEDDNIFSIYSAADGALWFGTRSGAVRYDGTAFAVLDRREGLANDWVHAVEIAADGAIWVGTERGAYRYEEGTPAQTIDALADLSIIDLAVAADGAVWVGTERGAYRSDGTSGGSVEPLAATAGVFVYTVYCDDDGAVWLGTERGVYRYDGTAHSRLTTEDGLIDDFVTAISRGFDGVLWFGTARGFSRYDSRTGAFSTLSMADGLVDDFVNDIHVAEDGVVWLATYGGVSRYDGETFTNFTTADGLADNHVWAIGTDREGHLWFGTEKGGVSRYDEETFVNYTTADGLVVDDVTEVHVHSDGTIWFGTGYAAQDGRGVSRYDGEEFTTFAVEDGLAANSVHGIDSSPDGTLWFGTVGGGVSRYDGTRFETLSSADGLLSDYIEDIYCDPEGVLWFGTGYPFGNVLSSINRDGVSRYDGETFTNFTTADGLLRGRVNAIYRSPDGAMWFGTGSESGIAHSSKPSGISRYDGETFVNFTAADGLGGNYIYSIHGDPDGTLWFGVTGGGITRYDGNEFTNFTVEDGLPGDYVQEALYRAADGILWVGTTSGISGYDGETWTTLDTRDGLVDNEVRIMDQDADGYLWIGTAGGVSRYKRSETRPEVRIDFAQTEERRSDNLVALPPVETDQRVAIGYHAIDFKTIPAKRQYRYRIPEISPDWSRATTEATSVHRFAQPGTYTFEVQAIDRDLRYSEPARMTIEVTPRYGQIAMVSGLVVLSISLVLAAGYGLRRRRERDQIREQLVEELEREMQTAHELQMSLMPKEAPQVPGIAVAGQCVPATEVGGDIFQYFSEEGKFALALADVTGHGMQAAVPAMTFSGILNTEMQYRPSLATLFGKLNATLHASLEQRTFICLSMGEVDPATQVLRLANCGSPYPCHYQAATGEVVELQMDAYPLGIRPGVAYEVIEVPLAPGDRVVFFSDGLVEVANAAGDFFGFERIVETIRQGCAEGLSAQNLMQRIFGEVQAFSGAVAQEDDQTLIVLQVEGEA